MRITALAVSAVILFSTCSIGCKSAPKMAWWKNSDAEKVAAANAPALPSEVAQQAVTLQANDPVQISTAPSTLSGGAAPAYTSTPAGYPDTGAPSYVPVTGQVSAPTTNSTTAMSSALPYDPNSVPAPKYAATNSMAQPTSESLAAPASRYSAATGMAASSPTAAYSSTNSPVGGYAVSSNTPQPQNGSASSASPTDMASGLGGRYSSAETAATMQPQTAYGNADTVQPVSAVASTQAYRPGGTSSYPGAEAGSSNYEVAARTEANSQTPDYGSNSSYPDSSTRYR